MNRQFSSYLRSLLRGCVAAIGIGLVVAGGCELLAARATSKPVADVLNSYTLGEVVLVASPFVVLALLNIRQVKCWLAGIVVTCGFWGFLYLPAAMATFGGANIGWGLVVSFLPLIVLIVSMLMLLPDAAERNHPNGS